MLGEVRQRRGLAVAGTWRYRAFLSVRAAIRFLHAAGEGRLPPPCEAASSLRPNVLHRHLHAQRHALSGEFAACPVLNAQGRNRASLSAQAHPGHAAISGDMFDHPMIDAK